MFTALLAFWLTSSYFSVDVYNWWYIGLYPGFLGILCSIIGKKDKQKKNYTIWSLPCGMEQIWDAKILVGIKMSAVAVAGLTLFSMMGQMLLESVGNLKMRQAIPISAQILAGIVLWLTTLWEIPFCLLLAQKISTFLMLVIHVGIYSILSTSVSLKPWFALFPGAITSRLMCVVIKVMPNGLPFEPGQVTYSPELGRVSGLLIGIPAALLWFLVFWLAGRTWFESRWQNDKTCDGKCPGGTFENEAYFFNSVSCGGAGYHRWFHAVLLSRDHRKSHGTDHGIF